MSSTNIEWKKLGEVFDVKDGTHDSPKYVNDKLGYPLVTSKNIKNGKLVLDNCNYISEVDYIQINKRSQVDINDIIMPMIGTIGNPCLIEEEPKYAIKNVALFKPKENSSKFLLYWLRSDFLKNKFKNDSRGGTQKFVSLKYLRNLPFPLLPLTEQKNIAKTLDKAKELIELRKASIEKLDELSKSVFIDMFGDPVENPIEWEVVKLASVIKIDAPMVQPNTPEYENLYLIGSDRISKNTGKILPAKTAKEDNVISKKFLFDDRYVLYSKIRPYLNKVAMATFRGLCSADMYPLRPIEDKINKEFLWKLLLSKHFLKYTETLPDRASIPKLNRKELLDYAFPLPSRDLQNKFAKTIQKIESQKALYEKELVKLEENFEALLAKSFG